MTAEYQFAQLMATCPVRTSRDIRDSCKAALIDFEEDWQMAELLASLPTDRR